jgi:hypothetical protein
MLISLTGFAPIAWKNSNPSPPCKQQLEPLPVFKATIGKERQSK